MDFDASLRNRWEPTSAGWRVDLPDGWNQGRSVFGGLTAALLHALAASQVDSGRVLRSMSLQFVRPVRPGDASATI